MSGLEKSLGRAELGLPACILGLMIGSEKFIEFAAAAEWGSASLFLVTLKCIYV